MTEVFRTKWQRWLCCWDPCNSLLRKLFIRPGKVILHQWILRVLHRKHRKHKKRFPDYYRHCYREKWLGLAIYHSTQYLFLTKTYWKYSLVTKTEHIARWLKKSPVSVGGRHHENLTNALSVLKPPGVGTSWCENTPKHFSNLGNTILHSD